MSNRIQIRRDTAINWSNANPILAEGEPALETDTKKEKIGDGVTVWNSLPYSTVEPLALEGYSESGTVLDEDLLVKIGDPAGFNVLLDLANKVFEGSGFKFSIGDYGEIRLSLGDVNNDYNGAKLIFDDYEGVWDFTDGVINMKNCAAVYLPENTMITTDDDDSNIHFDLSHQGGNKVKLKVPKMNTTDGVFLTGMTVRTIPISSTSQGYKGEVIFDGATKYECVEDDTWVKSTVITTF